MKKKLISSIRRNTVTSGFHSTKEKNYYLGKIYGYFIKYQWPEWLDGSMSGGSRLAASGKKKKLPDFASAAFRENLAVIFY